MLTKDEGLGNSLEVQWLGLCAFTSRDAVLIPGRGAKILQAVVRQKKTKNKGLIYKKKAEQGKHFEELQSVWSPGCGLTAVRCSHLQNGESSPCPHRAIVGILHYCACQSEASPTTEMLSEGCYYCLCHPFSHPKPVKNARTCSFH